MSEHCTCIDYILVWKGYGVGLQFVCNFVIEARGIGTHDPIEKQEIWITQLGKICKTIIQKVMQRASAKMVGLDSKILNAWQKMFSKEFTLTQKEKDNIKKLFSGEKITITPLAEASVAGTVIVERENKPTVVVKFIKESSSLD